MRSLQIWYSFHKFWESIVFFDICMTTENPLVEQEQALDEETVIQEPAKVILFNDEVHSFDEVIGQIIKATGCDEAKAEALTWEVHNTGKAMVFVGPITKCVQVSHVLEEIDLLTQIEV
jgi:ATP-dependent Clp protease adaptor protein ClpS